jgi:hypothetical protein
MAMLNNQRVYSILYNQQRGLSYIYNMGYIYIYYKYLTNSILKMGCMHHK